MKVSRRKVCERGLDPRDIRRGSWSLLLQGRAEMEREMGVMEGGWRGMKAERREDENVSDKEGENDEL